MINSDLKQVLLVHLCDYRDEVVHDNGDEEQAANYPIDLLEGVENHRIKGYMQHQEHSQASSQKSKTPNQCWFATCLFLSVRNTPSNLGHYVW